MSDPIAKNPPQGATAAATPHPAALPLPPRAKFRRAADQQGFTAFPNVILASGRLSCNARVAYGLLRMYAWSADHAWPHQNALAAQLGGHRSTLRRALRELLLLGLVTVERRGLQQTNVYWLEPLDTFAKEEAEWQGKTAAPPAAPPPDGPPVDHQEGAPVVTPDAPPVVVQDGAPVVPPFLRKKKTQGKEDTHGVGAVADAPSPGLACARLNDAGVSKPVAERLVEQFGAVACQQQLDWLPLRKPRDPVATLRRAIEEAWLPPDGNPRLRLPGERPYVPLAPPPLPVIDHVASAAGKLRARLELAQKGIVRAPAAASA